MKMIIFYISLILLSSKVMGQGSRYKQTERLVNILRGNDTIVYHSLRILKREPTNNYDDSVRQYTYYELPDKTLLKHAQTLAFTYEYKIGFRDYVEIYGKKYLLDIKGSVDFAYITTFNFRDKLYICFSGFPEKFLSPNIPAYNHLFVIDKKAFDRSQPNNIYTTNTTWKFKDIHFGETLLDGSSFYKVYNSYLEKDELFYMEQEDNHRSVPRDIEDTNLTVAKQVYVSPWEDEKIKIYPAEKENKEWYYITYGFKGDKLVLIENKWHFPISLE